MSMIYFKLNKFFFFILIIISFKFCSPVVEKNEITYFKNLSIKKKPSIKSLKKIPSFFVSKESKMLYLIQLKGDIGFFDMKESVLTFVSKKSLKSNKNFYEKTLKENSWKILQRQETENKVTYIVENLNKKNLMIFLKENNDIVLGKIFYKQKVY